MRAVAARCSRNRHQDRHCFHWPAAARGSIAAQAQVRIAQRHCWHLVPIGVCTRYRSTPAITSRKVMKSTLVHARLRLKNLKVIEGSETTRRGIIRRHGSGRGGVAWREDSRSRIPSELVLLLRCGIYDLHIR